MMYMSVLCMASYEVEHSVCLEIYDVSDFLLHLLCAASVQNRRVQGAAAGLVEYGHCLERPRSAPLTALQPECNAAVAGGLQLPLKLNDRNRRLLNVW